MTTWFLTLIRERLMQARDRSLHKTNLMSMLSGEWALANRIRSSPVRDL